MSKPKRLKHNPKMDLDSEMSKDLEQSIVWNLIDKTTPVKSREILPPLPTEPPVPPRDDSPVASTSNPTAADQSGGWQKPLNSWQEVKARFSLSDSRYAEFQYLKYLDLNNPFVVNYVEYHLGIAEPVISERLRNHYEEWERLNPPKWILSLVREGLKIPFSSEPPPILLPNNKSATQPENKTWIRETLLEYVKFGFIKKVSKIPKVVLPLQVSQHSSGKKCLIHDESALNEYVLKGSFKQESWEEMYNYSLSSKFTIGFDLKKFYHEIAINKEFEKYFGFMFRMADGEEPSYFVWTSLPYGYTRAPFIARSIIKPLIAKWRKLGILIVVFVDDGMSVSNDRNFLMKASLQIQCDLIRCGFIPGIEKCSWIPSQVLNWNGLKWDFTMAGISILNKRIDRFFEHLNTLKNNWPKVCYRDVSRFVGQVISMMPVLQERALLRSRYLQCIINVRHFHECSWDKTIEVGHELLNRALLEIQFWQQNMMKLNFREFQCKPPNIIGWVDASSVAAG